MKHWLRIFVLLLPISVTAQVDSIVIPVIESYDTTCSCYTDNFVFYMVKDTVSVNDSLAIEFGFRRLDRNIWLAAFSFTDSTGGPIAIRAAFINKTDPYDVNRDGELSILDLVLMIKRLFW